MMVNVLGQDLVSLTKVFVILLGKSCRNEVKCPCSRNNHRDNSRNRNVNSIASAKIGHS